MNEQGSVTAHANAGHTDCGVRAKSSRTHRHTACTTQPAPHSLHHTAGSAIQTRPQRLPPKTPVFTTCVAYAKYTCPAAAAHGLQNPVLSGPYHAHPGAGLILALPEARRPREARRARPLRVFAHGLDSTTTSSLQPVFCLLSPGMMGISAGDLLRGQMCRPSSGKQADRPSFGLCSGSTLHSKSENTCPQGLTASQKGGLGASPQGQWLSDPYFLGSLLPLCLSRKTAP